MKKLSVERITHLHQELQALNRGVPILSAFDRDVQQALKELLDIKSTNKTKRRLAARPAPFKPVTPPVSPTVQMSRIGIPLPASIKGFVENKFSATCPRCGTELSDTKPFTKRPCPSCERERIPVLLNSKGA